MLQTIVNSVGSIMKCTHVRNIVNAEMNEMNEMNLYVLGIPVHVNRTASCDLFS